MPEVFVGAGSNANPARALRRAAKELELQFGAIRCSNVYRSAAVGAHAADYLNLVVALETDRDVDSVREALRNIEALAGRARANAAVVELDLDLLVYGGQVDASRRLPRPGLFTTPFVLGPLAGLAPDLVHPITGERCELAWRAAENDDLSDVGTLTELK